MKKTGIVALACLLIGFSFTRLGAQQNEREILHLDGKWEIIFDHNNEGKQGLWYLNNEFSRNENIREINVPSAWELIEKDYEGVAFYRRSFNVPEEWKGKTLRLHFGAVNYISEVWLNDNVVGYHEGGFTPFEFRVDELIDHGELNTIIIRVVGPIILSDKIIDGIGPLETPQWRGGITGGIWQSVKLIATGKSFISDVFIQPDISNNNASFNIETNLTSIKGTAAKLELRIFDTENVTIPVSETNIPLELKPGRNSENINLAIPDAEYWSPDNPSLYKAEVKLVINGIISDEWAANFGMRDLTIKDRDFYLNGEPVYIKATFFEGLYPNGIASPDSEEMAREEIRLAKEAGFNMIRPWRRPPVPEWLDLTDEMGIMVVGSPALECMRLPLSTPQLPERVENEVRKSVLRDRNRASVVQWELFNELHRPILKQMMRPMAMLTRELDPTRLILDESGGWANGANMYLPEESEPSSFNDIHTYPGPFINKNLYDGFLAVGMTPEEKKNNGLGGNVPGRNVVPGLMSFISELGYGSLPELVTVNDEFREKGNPLTPAYRYHERLEKEQKEMLIESGFDEIYPDIKDFFLEQQHIHGSANKRMLEATRSNPEIDGYCIHALTGGDWILGAGLLDIWRKPKSYAYEATAEANRPRILTLRAIPANVYAEKGMRIEVRGINDLKDLNAELKVSVLSPSGEEVYNEITDVKLERGLNLFINEEVNTSAWNGKYILKAEMSAPGGNVIAENNYEFNVFSSKELEVPEKKIAILDFNGRLKNTLNNSEIDFYEAEKIKDKSVPLFVSGYNTTADIDSIKMVKLINFVKKGGTVIYLDGFSKDVSESNVLFPFHADFQMAKGLWTCIPHLVKNHEVFIGLPVNGAMRDIYENVWATSTLMNIGGEGIQLEEAVVASVGFEWFSRDHKMHYSGPGKSWWGSDMAVISLGKGKIIISQLRILPNLGKDPVADKILYNLINFVSKD